MRRQVKPFVTEVRGRGGRQRTAGFQQHPDPDDVFAGDERPPRSLHDDVAVMTRAPAPASEEDSYEAAMRAADALFSSSPQPKPTPPPAPRQPEPIAALDRSQPYQAPKSYAEMSAETFFKKVEPEPASATTQAVETAPAGESRRILADLSQTDELAVRLAKAPRRRGRQPGQKNKTKYDENGQPILTIAERREARRAERAAKPTGERRPITARDEPKLRLSIDPRAETTPVEPKRRGRKPGSKNKPKLVQPSLFDAPAPVAAPKPVVRMVAPTPVHIAIVRSALAPDAHVPYLKREKPGQQWQRRLRHRRTG